MVSESHSEIFRKPDNESDAERALDDSDCVLVHSDSAKGAGFNHLQLTCDQEYELLAISSCRHFRLIRHSRIRYMIRISAFILLHCACRVTTTGIWLACAISALQLATIPVVTAVIQTRPTAQPKHVQSGLQLAMFAAPILSSIAYTLIVLCSWDAHLKAAFGDIVAMLSAQCAVCKRCMTKVRCFLGLCHDFVSMKATLAIHLFVWSVTITTASVCVMWNWRTFMLAISSSPLVLPSTPPWAHVMCLSMLTIAFQLRSLASSHDLFWQKRLMSIGDTLATWVSVSNTLSCLALVFTTEHSVPALSVITTVVEHNVHHGYGPAAAARSGCANLLSIVMAFCSSPVRTLYFSGI
jgi:hypothetical protein